MDSKQQQRSAEAQRRLARQRALKRKKIAKRRRMIRFFIIFAVIYVVLMMAVAVGIFINLHIKSDDNVEKYDVEVSNPNKDEDEDNTVYSGDDVYFDSELYIPFEAIGELSDYTLTKDGDVVGIVFRESGEYAKFTVDTLKANVNGNEVELSSNSKFIDGKLYLPIEFYETHLIGFTATKNNEEMKYTVSRSTDEPYEFLLKKPSSTDTQSEQTANGTTEAHLDFTLDLSAYEQYMNPENRDEYLFLVNAENPLDENYVPDDLLGSIYTRDDGRATQKLRKYACFALEAFLKEAEACGIDGVTVTSAYRSYEYQSQLFQNEISITGSEEEAAKNVNPPGISEHQSGLCIDMHNLPAASTAFGGTVEGDWLEENAHKFGYILRYPKNKVSITGINYEPWHFRYVGRYHATKMHELGMCLEEYIEYINK